MAKTYHSSWASVDGGKFRLNVTAKFSDSSGIVVTPFIEIDDAFKKSHKYKFTYYKNDKTQTIVPTVNTNKKDSDDKKVSKAGKHKISGCSSFTIKDAAVSKPMSLSIGGKTVKINGGTIKNTKDKPNGLDEIRFEPISTTKWRISVSRKKAHKELDQPVTRVYLEEANYGKTPVPTSEWSQVYQHNISADYDAFDYSFDVDVEENEVYRFRTRVSGTTSGTEVFSTYLGLDYAHYTRPSETQLNYDDVHQMFSWQADIHDIDHGIVKGWHIYRSTSLTNKGTLVGSVNADINHTYYYWQDSESNRGKSFYYRLYSWNYDLNSVADRSIQECVDAQPVEVIGEPYTPTAGVSFNVYYDNNGYPVTKLNSPIDTSIESINVYRVINETPTLIHTFRVEDIDWSDISTYSYADTLVPTGEDATYYITFVNDSGESEPSDSVEPTGSRKPNPPTLESPVNNQVVMLNDGKVNLYWTHNSLDGSPQSGVKIQYRYNESSEWHLDESTQSDETYEIDFEDLGILSATNFYWKVCTSNGIQWSDYSDVSVFAICETPEVNIISPTEDAYILPLSVDFIYTDTNVQSGIKTATLSVLKDGDIVKQKTVDGSDLIFDVDHYTIALDGYLFEDSEDYTIRLDVLSEMGIRTSAEMNLIVAYSEAKEGSLIPIIDNDSETGYGYVSIGRDSYDEEGEPIEPAEVVNALLYRTANGESELLGEVSDEWFITDYLAPINMDYQYKLYQLYSDGTASIVEVEGFNSCEDSFIYWGKNYANICRARWNPTQSTSLSRPERALVRYSGRRAPVSYDSKAIDESVTFNAELSYAELQEFINMMNYSGTGIWKSVQGRCWSASFDLSWQRVQSQYPVDLYETTLKITRIEGE